MLILFNILSDINECNVTRPCNSLGNCVNTIGSFQCGCQAGYSGDGFNCTSKDSLFYFRCLI